MVYLDSVIPPIYVAGESDLSMAGSVITCRSRALR